MVAVEPPRRGGFSANKRRKQAERTGVQLQLFRGVKFGSAIPAKL